MAKGHYVIIGAGHAGVSAAEELRIHAPKAQVTIIDKDPGGFYFRPAMKYFLKGKISREELAAKPTSFWKDQKITLLTSKVSKISLEEHFVQTGDGETLTYNKLLIATGANAFKPPVPGIEDLGVIPMITLADSEGIKACTEEYPSGTFTVIGAGVLGLELADCLVHQGGQVNVVQNQARIAPRLFDDRCAKIMARLFGTLGVKFYPSETVQEIAKTPEGNFAVKTAAGLSLKSDKVFYCVGVRSNTSLAGAAGIETNKGILVNRNMETSAPDVYAAGDCAEFKDGELIRLWAPAGLMGRAAARNMTGRPERFDNGCVHAYTVLLDRGYHALGNFNPPTRGGLEILHRNFAGDNYFKLVIKGDKLVGAIGLGEIHNPIILKRVIETGKPIPPDLKDQLLDLDFDFRLLL